MKKTNVIPVLSLRIFEAVLQPSLIPFQVSAMQCGWLPISQEAMIVGPVSMHESVSDSESIDAEAAARDLGSSDKVKLLIIIEPA